MLAVSRYMNLASKLVWSYSISIVMILLTVMFMINILRGILFQWLLSDGAISVGFQNLKMQLTAENFGTKKGPLRGGGEGATHVPSLNFKYRLLEFEKLAVSLSVSNPSLGHFSPSQELILLSLWKSCYLKRPNL